MLLQEIRDPAALQEIIKAIPEHSLDVVSDFRGNLEVAILSRAPAAESLGTYPRCCYNMPFFHLCTIVRLRRWRGGPRAIHGHTLVTHSDIINRQTTVSVRGIITDESPLDQNSLPDCLRRDRKSDRCPVDVEYIHAYRRFSSQLLQV